MLFVENGLYSVGYKINNKIKMRKRFGATTVIGGFQLAYHRRFDFIYRTFHEMNCMAIRDKRYKILNDSHPDFILQLKLKFWNQYSQYVYQPITKRKNLDIRYYKHRNDYDQVLTLQEGDGGASQLVANIVRENFKDITSILLNVD